MNVYEVSKDFNLENIVPFFQPIVDLRANVVWGYECLARLIDQGQNVFLPSDFLYLVDKERCYGELTRKIFRESAHYFRDVQVNWSINLTRRDILDAQILSFLEQYLQDYPNSHRVTVEIGGETVRQHPKQFKAFILLAKTLGLQILLDRICDAQDDLLKLLDFPIDGIKVSSDILLQWQLSPERLSELLVKADANDVAIIAEHIEDHQTLEAIQAMPVHYGQGFYISTPGPGDS